jgi:hypothetical protein
MIHPEYGDALRRIWGWNAKRAKTRPSQTWGVVGQHQTSGVGRTSVGIGSNLAG